MIVFIEFGAFLLCARCGSECDNHAQTVAMRQWMRRHRHSARLHLTSFNQHQELIWPVRRRCLRRLPSFPRPYTFARAA